MIWSGILDRTLALRGYWDYVNDAQLWLLCDGEPHLFLFLKRK
jgi:hypothetical protein